MKKRLFMMLAVLALVVCMLPMVVAAEENYTYMQGTKGNHKVFLNGEYVESVTCSNDCLTPCVCGRGATGHVGEVIPAVPATCTADGSTAGERCTNANCPVNGGILTAPETVGATGHAIRYAMADNSGHTQHYMVCDNGCGIDAWEDHAWGTSCESECVCGTQKVLAGHTEHTLEAKAPSCTATGLTEGKDCSVCGEILDAQEPIPMDPHDYADPTCTEAGLCSCGAVDPDNDSALGHTVGSGISQRSDGIHHGYSCGRCQEFILEEHEYVGASCTAEGTCICLKTSKLPHAPVTDAAVAATCEKTGLTEGSHCANCPEVMVAQEVIPALGHKWNNGVIVQEASYVATGVKRYTCQNDASHFYDEATPVIPQNYDPNLDRVPRTGNAFVEWLYALIFA